MQYRHTAALLCAFCLATAMACAATPAATLAGPEPLQQVQEQTQGTITSVTSVAHTYGFGENVAAVALHYTAPVLSSSLSPADFVVTGKTISKAYASDTAYPGEEKKAGPYVILDLVNTNPQSDQPFSAQSQAAHAHADGGKAGDAPSHSDRTMPDLNVTVQQVNPIARADGEYFAPSDKALTTTALLEPDIKGFTEYTYTDAETGATIPYYLYLPEGYTPKKSYPLMVFIPDASTNIDNPKITLVQGNGATVWAEPEEQKKHPSIILAVQYPQRLVNSLGMMTTDDNVWTPGLTLVSNLIKHVTDTYSVDKNRIYGTGQSQGGMANIAISDKYPDLFAAQYLVACQWNTDEMKVLKDKNLWILVSEGDTKAYPGMNDAVKKWEALGAKVATAPLWNSHATAAEFSHLVQDVERQDANINYTVFKAGNHMYTWTIAYNIEGIRDWIYLQTLNGTPVSFNTDGLPLEEKRQIAGYVLDQGLRYEKLNTPAADTKALAYFREADKLGHFKAARWIGLAYANGRGTTQSYKEAAKWYKKAAKAGDITGAYLLGQLYEKGQGVGQSYKKALQYYNQSAQRGDIIAAPAMTAAAVLYADGKGTTQDIAKAKELLTKAAAAGYAPAKEALAGLTASAVQVTAPV